MGTDILHLSPYLVEFGAGNEIRTRDPNLGKVVLYQLSYSRINQAGYCRDVWPAVNSESAQPRSDADNRGQAALR